MSEKILNEFSVRLNKSRMQLTEVNGQVDNLKKEVLKLRQELQDALVEKDEAERVQENLMSKYINAKVLNEEEVERNARQKEELSNLRKLKKKLTREKDLWQRDWEKLELELQQSIKERAEIEYAAQNLSERLEKAQAEKDELEAQYNDNENAIQAYNAEIRELKTELESMRNVITNTFGNELNSANIMYYGSSPMKKK